jgi:hypothetical protein
LLKATVEAEFFGEEWHPVSTKYANSTENVAVRATMCGRDTIDRRPDNAKRPPPFTDWLELNTVASLLPIRFSAYSTSVVKSSSTDLAVRKGPPPMRLPATKTHTDSKAQDEVSGNHQIAVQSPERKANGSGVRAHHLREHYRAYSGERS